MKIKTDFVTNSSSTGFILQIDCSLKPKKVQEKVNISEILHVIEKRHSYNFNKKKSKVEDYSYSSNLRTKFIEEEDGYVDEEVSKISGNLEIELLNSDLFDEEKIEPEKCILMNLRMSTLYLYESPKDFYTTKLISILDDMFKNINGEIEVSFLQSVLNIYGDGWEVGDPHGQYSNQYELYTNEVKVGKIVRRNDIWISILKGYGNGE